MYNVSAKAICEANPGLSAENFRIGQVILIPLEQEEQTATQLNAYEQTTYSRSCSFRMQGYA